MKILAESQIKRTNSNPIYDVLKDTRTSNSKAISLFSRHSEKKRLITEANILAKEAEKDSKIAYLLLADFKIEKEEATGYKRKAENIKTFAKHEFISAKKLLDETGLITKNEKKRKRTNDTTYVRVKKKKFAGGVEIDDYTNGQLTRTIRKIGESITITAIDLNKNASIYSFDNKGNLLTYFECVTTSKNRFYAKEKISFEGENLSTIDIEYKKYGDSSETSKKHFVFKGNKLVEVYKSFLKTEKEESEISANEVFSYTSKEEPIKYYKKYTRKKQKDALFESSFKYETIDYLTYLKESIKNIQIENGTEKKYISKFKKRNLKTIIIQDFITRNQRCFTFDLEGNPINYDEEII